jgi:hypothetical protein
MQDARHEPFADRLEGNFEAVLELLLGEGAAWRPSFTEA